MAASSCLWSHYLIIYILLNPAQYSPKLNFLQFNGQSDSGIRKVKLLANRKEHLLLEKCWCFSSFIIIAKLKFSTCLGQTKIWISLLTRVQFMRTRESNRHELTDSWAGPPNLSVILLYTTEFYLYRNRLLFRIIVMGTPGTAWYSENRAKIREDLRSGPGYATRRYKVSHLTSLCL